MSIEQLQDFHQVRRLLRVVAPNFRLMANENLDAGDAICDVKNSTIEVGEGTPIEEAVGAMLFQIGHLLLRHHPDYGIFFGDDLESWEGAEGELIDRLSDLGVSADQVANKWASEVYRAYWSNVNEKRIDEIVSSYVWTRDEWKKYFS